MDEVSRGERAERLLELQNTLDTLEALGRPRRWRVIAAAGRVVGLAVAVLGVLYAGAILLGGGGFGRPEAMIVTLTVAPGLALRWAAGILARRARALEGQRRSLERTLELFDRLRRDEELPGAVDPGEAAT